MLEYLFGSKTRLRLLEIFFRDPQEKFFVRELARASGSQINAVRRELSNLLNASIIIEQEDKEQKGRYKFYSVNGDSLLYDELGALLIKAHVMGKQALVQKLSASGSISFLLLSGRFVGEPELPTDVLIVGRVTESNVKKVVTSFERKLGFEIRYTIMSTSEFKERRNLMDKFLYSLFEGKHIKAIDQITSKL